jgi:arsenate reductase
LESYSAGTETKPQINQDAVRLMKQLYGIDMEQTQYSKTFDQISTPDIAISMGCDVGCPYIGREFDDNWGLHSNIIGVVINDHEKYEGSYL